MKDDNVIQRKSYAFAVRIVKVYQFLWEEKENKLRMKNYELGIKNEES